MDRTSITFFVLFFAVGVPSSSGQNYVNVATGKTYSQISTYVRQEPSSNAANGNTGGVYNSSNCIHTDVYRSSPNLSYDTNPWWEVDLGRTYPVYTIKVWARNDFFFRLYPCTITVDGQQCATVTSMSSRSQSVTCTSGVMYGQQVRLTRTGRDQPLNLCEFEILVCQAGWYGDTCNSSCLSTNCLNNQCDRLTGLCTACPGNFTGDYCSDCRAGRYGNSCSRQCPSNNCLNNQCNRHSGLCTACRGHFAGDYCTDCRAGWYGNSCNNQCPSNNCLNNQCNRQSGLCTACRGHFAGDYCTECDGSSYGVDCGQTCGQCQDGAACDKVNGQCPLCEPGWYPTMCDTTCQDGYYGVNCTQQCETCLNGASCNKTNGHCSSCPIGKQPPLCDTDCQGNTYGQNCRESCGQCKGGQPCNTVTGKCTAGCEPGWKNDTCKAARSKEGDAGQQSIVAPVVGSVVGVGLLLTISITAAICWRRRSLQRPERTNGGDSSFPAPSIALSDKRSCTPDLPSHVSSASVLSTPVEEGVYSELGDPAENYDKLHPYSNRHADRQPYAEFALRARDVSKPDVDSAYVNTALPMEKEDSTF